jgi:flagellar biogenesis protein FliO
MSLKKILLTLFLLSTAMANAADPLPNQTENAPFLQKEAAPAPEQVTPEKAADQTPAPLPSSTEMTGSYENAFVRMLVTLLGLLFLVFATFWILRRLGKGKFKMGSGRTINVIEKRALSPKSMLYIVEIGNSKVLISESQLEVRTLITYEEIPEVSE